MFQGEATVERHLIGSLLPPLSLESGFR